MFPLTAADPDFPVAPEIVDAMRNYMEDGYFSYAPAEGLMDFRMAIASYYERNYQIKANPQWVLPVNSAAHGLFICAQAFLNPGDEVIIPNPVDFLFRKSVEAAKGKVVTTCVDPVTADFNWDEMAQLVTPKTKAIFVCNPNNPLGIAPSFETLKQLISFAEKHDLWLLSDEIWADITYGKPTISCASSDLPNYAKRIVVSGLSKNFGLAGLRIGYLICTNEHNYQLLYQASGHATTAFGIASISQVAGTAALNHGETWKNAFLLHLEQRRNQTIDFVAQFPYLEMEAIPDATYLAFPKLVNTELSVSEFLERINKQCKVALVPGGTSWFESASEQHVRICYATSEAILAEAFQRMNSFHLV
jgi:aspartate/methionine/tyrosine aminotransferase